MKKILILIRSLGWLILAAYLGPAARAQQSVVMQHHDPSGTGWYNQETQLTTANVRPGTFGKLFSRPVDDQVYAQPLVLAGVNIPGTGLRNLVLVATVNNSVYAFDADSASVTAPYWQVSLTASGGRPVRNTDMTGACGGGYRDFSGNMGIVGTPVIDTATGTLYVVARSVSTAGNTFYQYLHALDVRTGAERAGSPRLITATVNGHGDGSVNGQITFDPQKQNQRPGLVMAGGLVYITWASHCDWGPYHGWIMGYDKTTLEQKVVYNTTPEGYNGGIWMSAAAPAVDSSGNLYVAVGNGSVGRNGNPSDVVNRSESALKLTPSGSSLSVSTFFTPMNISELEASDLDFGVTEMLLIPGTNRVMTSCKDGNIYLLDRDNMGGYSSGSNQVVQSINLGTNAHLRSSLAYYHGTQAEYVYTWSENALLKALPYDRSAGRFNLGATISSGVQGPVGNNGAFLAVSSNGSADSSAILWAAYAASGDANQSVRPGILRAFDANDVTRELWNSSIYPSDDPGNYAKFNCPVIANGKVYLATFSNQLVVYGLQGGPGTDTCQSVNLALGRPASASSSADASQFPAGAAVDGSAATRWASLATDPQWLQIDLGKRYDLCSVVLNWAADYARDFQVQVSDDSLNWTPLIRLAGNSSLVNTLRVHGTGRYLRVLATASATGHGYSLTELEAYGSLSANQCAEPAALSVTDIYENTAVLHWSGPAADAYLLQYKTVSAPDWISVVADTTRVQLTNLSCATDYLFRVRHICGAGDTSGYAQQSAFSTLACNSHCGPLPTRWTTQDVGDVGAAGSACFNAGVFELHGSGTDIWDTQDAFRFAFKTFVGDGEIRVRVVTLDNSNPWNKCGIMFRESLAPGSRHAFLALTSGNGVAFQNRTQTDGFSNNVNTGPGTSAPYWLRLDKKGSLYTAYMSVNGSTWTQVGNPVDAGFGAGTPVYAGLALTSHNNDVLSVATLDNYALGGAQDYVLQSFTAQLQLDKTVQLQWVTTLESNIENFVVERSADNRTYQAVDTVAAVNAGRFTQTYTRTDPSPLPGISYYRLRITTQDGTVTYSAPVFVRITAARSPLVFPNPARGTVHIVAGTEPIRTVQLFDLSGRLVRSLSASGASEVSLDTRAFASGLYLVEIRTSVSVYRQKLLLGN
ncbi:MAG TPA: discoidin domain-containing protein [Chitinophagaceae bacterium]|nr:discoidin domain-containing protein [Chitinophagaceae bacterium]